MTAAKYQSVDEDEDKVEYNSDSEEVCEVSGIFLLFTHTTIILNISVETD